MANTTTWERTEAGFYRMRGQSSPAFVVRVGRGQWEARYTDDQGSYTRGRFASAKSAKWFLEDLRGVSG